jgi:hypothetical protein
VSDWPLLELPDDATDEALIALCWEYFECTYLRDAEGDPLTVRDWRGTVVRMSSFAFDHIVSGDADYRDGFGLHEVAFVPTRAERLPWIGLTLAGDSVIEVRHQERKSSRGRRLKRRVLIVTENSYVVVLDRQGDGCLRLRTAFPADASYLSKIRREGAQLEVHHPATE